MSVYLTILYGKLTRNKDYSQAWKILYEWVKTNYITQKEFVELVKELQANKITP